MKTTAWIAGIMMAGVTLLTTSCACNMKTWSFSDEDMVKDVRNLKGFERIEVSGSPTVHYTQSDTFSVVVKAPDAIIEDIITEKQGNTLVTDVLRRHDRSLAADQLRLELHALRHLREPL